VRAVVIGGGLAGLTAAIALAEQGAEVTLLEAKPRLGGATCSFNRDGLIVDTGQHVFLRCCSAYQGLLAKLGMTAHAPVQPRFDVTVLAPGRAAARLHRTALPAPLHMLPGLAGFSLLTRSERAKVSLAALAMRRVNPADPATDTIRFGDWLARHGQSEHARRVMWDLFTISALNIAGDDASLSLAATVVKTGLLGDKDAADIGVPALPLGELHGDAAARLLTRLGARIHLSTKVAGIELASAPAFRIALARGRAAGLPEVIGADAVVLAVPPEQAARLIPADSLPAATVNAWSGLGASPIVNVHVIYDRKVMDLPFAAGVNSPVQWVFDRTAISGLASSTHPDRADPDRADPDRADPDRTHPDRSVPMAPTGPLDGQNGAGSPPAGAIGTLAGGAGPETGPGSGPQYLAVSLSAGDEYVDMPVADLREKFVPALAALLPAARDANVAEFFVTRERRATFRQAPGSGALRPPAGTKLPGLVLAGAWTDTGWPDTMEGAVRSGLAAAIELRRMRTQISTNADSLGVRP
jgi:squalene-associated FAD-dependent desaturase